jgi:hypothetical protein
MKTVTKCLPLEKPGTDIPEESKVLYRSKDGKNERTFDALSCHIAILTSSALPNSLCRSLRLLYPAAQRFSAPLGEIGLSVSSLKLARLGGPARRPCGGLARRSCQ